MENGLKFRNEKFQFLNVVKYVTHMDGNGDKIRGRNRFGDASLKPEGARSDPRPFFIPITLWNYPAVRNGTTSAGAGVTPMFANCISR